MRVSRGRFEKCHSRDYFNSLLIIPSSTEKERSPIVCATCAPSRPFLVCWPYAPALSSVRGRGFVKKALAKIRNFASSPSRRRIGPGEAAGVAATVRARNAHFSGTSRIPPSASLHPPEPPPCPRVLQVTGENSLASSPAFSSLLFPFSALFLPLSFAPTWFTVARFFAFSSFPVASFVRRDYVHEQCGPIY